MGSEKSIDRSVYAAKEHGKVAIPLEHLIIEGILHIYPEVTGKNYFSIHLKDNKLVFQAGAYIGLIPVNDRVAIDVRPRVPLRNIEKILSFTEQPFVSLRLHARQYETTLEQPKQLLDFMADDLMQALAVIEQKGLHREYVLENHDTSFPRGRIQVSNTMQRHHAKGMKHRVAASWFSSSGNIGTNQCLKYALWYLAEHYRRVRPRRGHRKIVGSLNRNYLSFNEIDLDRSRSFLGNPVVINPAWMPTNRAYYQQSIQIAKAIIRDRGITFDGRKDEILMASLLVNMEKAFEEYIRKVLQNGMAMISSEISVFDGNKRIPGGARKKLFDDVEMPEVTPDILCDRIDNSTDLAGLPIIIEIKYKPITELPERSDLNQAITYGVSYRAHHVVIVHPRVQASHAGLNFLGRLGGMLIYGYAFDLSPKDLYKEEIAFVNDIYELANPYL